MGSESIKREVEDYPVTLFVALERGLFGCQARHDSFPLSLMIRGVLSPGLVVSVDR